MNNQFMGPPSWLRELPPGAVHVVGASGAEGTALLRQLAGPWGIKGLVAHDFAEDSRAMIRSLRRANPRKSRAEREALVKEVLRLPVEYRLGSNYLDGLEQAEVIFASQNWFNYAPNLPAIPQAIAKGARLSSLVELAMDGFSGHRIGVTGSNGKSTTSALIRQLLELSSGPFGTVLQGGNDRSRQVSLEEVVRADEKDVLIWEVSNRHLRDRGVPSDIAVLTNVTANHIEDHGSWEAYVEAKRRLPEHAKSHIILSGQDPVSCELAETLDLQGRCLWRFGAKPGTCSGQGFVWWEGEQIWSQEPQNQPNPVRLGGLETFSLLGEHNRLNLSAALAAALALGAEPTSLEAALPDLKSLPGRLEEVAKCAGQRWIYDIQATTAPAAEAGIRAVTTGIGAGSGNRKLLLIVGGEDKGMDYRGMAQAAVEAVERLIALPGSGTDALLDALAGQIPVEEVQDLDQAISRAKDLASPGSNILLSPGCAFFFSRYIDGGPSFEQRVKRQLGIEPK